VPLAAGYSKWTRCQRAHKPVTAALNAKAKGNTGGPDIRGSNGDTVGPSPCQPHEIRAKLGTDRPVAANKNMASLAQVCHV